ncbi:MAG: hypothetical protein M3Z41_04370, partial [Candidatus Eremiobacteraeota bacterium]|nr:hypothetical protein [Candidatus Eremiobacteraeota bacterium]
PTTVHCAVEAGEFDAYLDDDLNTAGALGWLQKKVRDARAALGQDAGSAHALVALVERSLDVLGLPASAQAAGFAGESRVVTLSAEHRAALRALAEDGRTDATVQTLDDAALVDWIVRRRDEARAGKDFATSDRMRDALQSAGVALRDTKAGTQWSLDGGR